MNVGPLTQIDALELFGCFRLASHIDVYRRLRHRIRTEMVDHHGKQFARYHYEGKSNEL